MSGIRPSPSKSKNPRPKEGNNIRKPKTRPGFALAFVIPLLFSGAIAGTVTILAHYRVDSLHSASRRAFTSFLEHQNFETLQSLENLSKPPDESPFARYDREEHASFKIVRQMIRQFPDSETRRRFEDIVFLVFLQNALSDKSPPRMFPKTPESRVLSLAARLFPENDWGGREKNSLVFIEPSADRWLMVPSLQNILRVAQSLSVQERFFITFLFSESCAGIGTEQARKTWGKIRALESNIGRDSLGSFPASIFNTQ